MAGPLVVTGHLKGFDVTQYACQFLSFEEAEKLVHKKSVIVANTNDCVIGFLKPLGVSVSKKRIPIPKHILRINTQHARIVHYVLYHLK